MPSPGGGAWAQSQIPDLRARATMVRKADDGEIDLLERLNLSVLGIAGDSKPLVERMQEIMAIGKARDITGAGDEWAKRPHESLSDWAQRAMGHAVERIAGIDGSGEALNQAYKWYSTYNVVIASWAATAATASQFGKHLASPGLIRALGARGSPIRRRSTSPRACAR